MFVGLEAASSESGDAWARLLTGLGERGLRCPRALFGEHSCPSLMWGVLDRAQSAGAGFSDWPTSVRRCHLLTSKTGHMTPTDSAAIASDHERKKSLELVE